MENKEKKTIEILEKYNQNHIVEHLEKLNSDQKDKLINQIQEIDFEEIIDLYKKTQTEREKIKGKIEKLQTTIADEIKPLQKKEYIDVGNKVIIENRFAVVTMAGGQGTRLRA